MWCLFGRKADASRRLVATFDSEQQLLAYLSWATLRKEPDGTRKFEQNTPLTGCTGYDYAEAAAHPGEGAPVPHNPSPGML